MKSERPTPQGRPSSSAKSLLILQEPPVRITNPLGQRGGPAPTQLAEPGNIQQLAGSAIGFGCIENQPALKAHRIRHQLRELRNRHVCTGAHIDELTTLIAIHQENGSIREVVHMQELATRLTHAPYDNVVFSGP